MSKLKIVFTSFDIEVKSQKDSSRFLDDLESLCRKYATKKGEEYAFDWRGE